MSGFSNDILVAENVDFRNVKPAVGQVTSNGQLLIGSTAAPNIRVGNLSSSDSSILITNGPGTIDLKSNPLVVPDLHTAKWIVNPTSNQGGNQTTIQAAISVASSGDTIFITPGTYTENLTLKSGVNLVAFNGDSNTPNVTIIGKATFTAAGTVSISNIRLQTNADFVLAVTGSAASIVNLNNCYINCSNNTGISFTTSSSSAVITLNNCTGDLGTTGIGLFASSSSGTLNINYSIFTNTGGSSTANTISAGVLTCYASSFKNPITSSSTSTIGLAYCNHDTATQNATSFTNGGSGNAGVQYCVFYSGTASAISTSQILNIESCHIISSNTNAITGAGSIFHQGLTFGSSKVINTSTQTGGTLIGSQNTAPPAGFLGEQIRSFVGGGTPVSITTATNTNITSISVTAGVWDISGIITYSASAITGTNFTASLSTTSATLGTNGDNEVGTPYAPTAAGEVSLTIPSWRQVFTTTTTVYLVARAAYTVGSLTAYGRVSATRVG